MKNSSNIAYLILICIVTIAACDSGPKVISSNQEEGTAQESNTGIFSNGTTPHVHESATGNDESLHTVVVKEVLPTEKYVYLRVTEQGNEFWIATGKRLVKIGETYFYSGGLLKTNFESREYNRMFDKIYLVSNIVEANHGNATNTEIQNTKNNKIERTGNGSVKIADLVGNPQKYAGTVIQVSGECVKINPNIMGRNWIHLKDGSKDEFDLVVTTNIQIPIGHTVTMTGTVVLNKDFGSGYKYDVLLEDGNLVR